MTMTLSNLQMSNVRTGTPPPYSLDAADFDGTNDWMTRAPLTGISNSNKFTMSVWVKQPSLVAGRIFHIGSNMPAGGTSKFRLARALTGEFTITGLDAAVASTLILSTSAYTNTALWYQVLISIDLSNTSTRHVYVNDVADPSVTWSTYVDAPIDFNGGVGSAIGGTMNGSQKWNGCMAQLAFWPGLYVDLSNTTIRRQFIDAAGKPTDYGDGTFAGATPSVLLNVDTGQPASDFATNLGNGGNYTITGALTTCSTSP